MVQNALVVISQLIFDCLLTLCELCKDLPPLLRDLWQLLMLIPTQTDLLQQSLERMCMDRATLLRQYHQLDVDPDPAELIVRGEDHLSAAVQIIDNLLQPAPEMLLTLKLQQYQ